MAKKHPGGVSGCTKSGRKKKACEIYRSYNVRNKNKRIKIRRHIKKFENDLQAVAALKRV